MNWITLVNGESLNMERAERVKFDKDESGTRYALVCLGSGLALIQDQDAIEQLEMWMTDNSEVLE